MSYMGYMSQVLVIIMVKNTMLLIIIVVRVKVSKGKELLRCGVSDYNG